MDSMLYPCHGLLMFSGQEAPCDDVLSEKNALSEQVSDNRHWLSIMLAWKHF
jgi:hypothetical protein